MFKVLFSPSSFDWISSITPSTNGFSSLALLVTLAWAKLDSVKKRIENGVLFFSFYCLCNIRTFQFTICRMCKGSGR